jgi:chromosome segregation ATPase
MKIDITSQIEELHNQLSNINIIINNQVESQFNTINNTMTNLKTENEALKKMNEYLTNDKERLQIQINILEENNKNFNILKTDYEAIKKINEYLTNDKNVLQLQVSNLEDDHRNLTKVSKIIALENENARLRNQIDNISNTSKKNMKFLRSQDFACVSPQKQILNLLYQNDQDSVRSSQSSDILVGQSEELPVELPVTQVEQPEELPEELPVEQSVVKLKEKKIGNIVYYINNVKKVFLKMDDGTVGSEIGTLVKNAGVTRLVKC